MKSSNLLVAAIFFALGFIIAWQVWGTPTPSNTPVNEPTDEETKVIMETPEPGQEVSSPLTVRGQVRGTWYFEASFPIELVDSDGQTLATAVAQAQSDWMTEDWVPFEATLNFNPGSATEGELILHKDNPSGLPENDDEIRIPVEFQ